MSQEETDYLIVGSGATGMAFTDTLLAESDASITIVGREHQPGGHWLDAYPFVTLHQPSQYYGIASLELSNGQVDQSGLNAGMYNLATGADIVAYYQQAMTRFLATGRVRYLPMSAYCGNFCAGPNEIRSILGGQTHSVQVNRAVVDATFLRPAIPATHTPAFSIDRDVRLVPINGLAHQSEAADAYTVLGSGKTGMDACLWLMKNGVDPDVITWIMPRDSWMLDRANTQPGIEFFEQTIGALANQFESIANAQSITDMFDRLEHSGYLVRLDPAVRPTMFHAATVSQAELTQLRRIKRVIRQGRVTAIHANTIELEHGQIPTSTKHLHVDCTASAVRHHETKPIFEDGLITPQLVRSYQPAFSASLVAYVEAHYGANATDKEAVAASLNEKNNLCAVVPIPNRDTDFIRFTAAAMINQYTWSQDKTLRNWIAGNRLDGFSKMMSSIDKNDADRQSILLRLRNNSMPAAIKLQQFLRELKTANG